MGDRDSKTSAVSSLEEQFKEVRLQLEDSERLHERIRAVVTGIDSCAALIHADLLLVHQPEPVSEVLDQASRHIGTIKELYGRLADIFSDLPGQYYRFHGSWRSETQAVVSLIAFMHWLETGRLLLHSDAEEKLGLNNNADFRLDIEDYLTGICLMSNEMPRYVVNKVITGDYDCPNKVLKFLADLHASFRLLTLRNDFLRKKFDGMKYDLRRVEEVYYDVKIRGLSSEECFAKHSQ